MASTGLRKLNFTRLAIASLFLVAVWLWFSADDDYFGFQQEAKTQTSGAGDAKFECVILLHGLARTAKSMTNLQRDLESDYRVVNNSYPSKQHAIQELAKLAIEPALLACGNAKRIHFVTHSLGGILVRAFLSNKQSSQQKISRLGHTIMLGPPNNGSELVDFFANNYLFKKYNGPAGLQLGTDQLSVAKNLGDANFDLGIIAGSKSYNPFFSWLIPGDDDGKVSVTSSRLAGMQDHLVLPVNHTFMMNDATVIAQVRHYLNFGQFSSD